MHPTGLWLQCAVVAFASAQPAPVLTAETAAEFRRHVDVVLGSLDPICPRGQISKDQAQRYQPIRARMARLEQAVAGTDLAAIIAKARVRPDPRTLNCMQKVLDRATLDKMITANLVELDRAMGRAEQIASPFILAKGAS